MLEYIKKYFQSRQTTLISGLSAFLIIVLGFLLFSYFSRVNKVTVTKQTSQVEETSPEGLLTEATKSSALEEKTSTPTAQKQITPAPVVKKEEPSKPTETKRHTVVQGETLSKIASQYYGDPNQYTLIAFLRENNIRNPNLIHAGNIFVIPSSQLAKAAPALAETKQLPASGFGDESQSKTHLVNSGDTLWDLAETYYGNGFDWVKILEANSDRVGYLPNQPTVKALILPGQVLTIPSG